MQYDVKLTPRAIAQIREVIEYISKVLLVPDTAASWADRLQKEISDLSEMPERYPLFDHEPWRSRGIRKMPVMNFIVYYFVDQNTKTVWVTAAVYGKRDQLNALREMP